MKYLMTLLLLLLTPPAFATTYFIDCTAGNDSNSGTSIGQEFKTATPVEGSNFLKPDDHVDLKAGCTWSGTDAHMTIASAGTIGHPIIIESYGVGVDPIFDGSVPSSDSVTTWDVFDSVNHVYVTHESVSFNVDGLILDGTSSVARMWNAASGQNSQTLVKNFDTRMYQGKTLPAPVYLKLKDGSDPNTHTIRFNRYGPYSNRGIVRTDDTIGSFIEFHHIKVMGSIWMGFSSSGQYVSFYDSDAFANGREGFYILKNAVNNSTGAAHNSCKNCTVEWNNVQGSQGTSAGQGITWEAPYFDLIDSTIHDNHMTGWDALDYNSSTDSSHGRLIRVTSYDNSHRSQSTADFFGFDPSAGYIDGGHDMLVVDSYFYKSASFINGNAVRDVTTGSEHPSTKPVYNIYFINTRWAGNNYVHLGSQSLNCTGSACNVNNNIWVINNSFYGQNGSGAYGFGALLPLASGGVGYYSYNNIYFNNSGGLITTLPSTGLYHGDYNIFKTTGTAIATSTTLAQWQATTGQDAHSKFIDPKYTTNGTDFHLQNTATGQAVTSPAVDAGVDPSTVENHKFIFGSVGNTRSDNVLDTGTEDIGYHYNVNYKTDYNIWWIRTDGGTDIQCNGLADKAYPGSGTSQSCAYKSLYYLMKYYSDGGPTVLGNQHLQYGDLVIIGDNANAASSFEIGNDFTNQISGCSKLFPYGCYLTPITDGQDINRTTSFIGRAGFNGCGVKTELWGTQSVDRLLNVDGANNIDIECLQLQDHSSCGFRVGTNQCSESYPNDVGNYARYGIRGFVVNNLLMSNLDIHGFSVENVNVGGLNTVTTNKVNIDGGYLAGWDFDNGQVSGGTINPTVYNTGKLSFTDTNIRFNGCREAYPRSGVAAASNYSDCTDGNDAGYGDGLGTYLTGGDWKFERVNISHNSSDGLDLLYRQNGVGSLIINQSLFEGNDGNQVKDNGGADIENSKIIGNCKYYQSAGITTGPHFKLCRAGGDSLVMDAVSGASYKLYNTTIYTEGATTVLIPGSHDTGTCDGTQTYDFQNNQFVSNTTGGLFGDLRPATCNTPTITTAYSLVYHVSGNTCPAGATNKCSTNPVWVASISSGAATNISNIDLQSTSPAISSGNASAPMSYPTLDYYGVARGTRNDMGASNFQGCLLTVDGGACSSSTTCCGGFCCSSVCASTACSLTANGGACAVNADCSSGNCCSNICSASTCGATGGTSTKKFTGTFQCVGTGTIE